MSGPKGSRQRDNEKGVSERTKEDRETKEGEESRTFRKRQLRDRGTVRATRKA